MSLTAIIVIAIAATVAVQFVAAGVLHVNVRRRRRSRRAMRLIRSYTA